MYDTKLASAPAILEAVANGECTVEQAVTRANEVLARATTQGRKAKRWHGVIATVTGASTPEAKLADAVTGAKAAFASTPVDAVAAAQAQLEAAKAAFVTAQAAAASAPSADAVRESAIRKLETAKFMTRDERAALLAYVTRT